jgi:hypothetical protein
MSGENLDMKKAALNHARPCQQKLLCSTTFEKLPCCEVSSNAEVCAWSLSPLKPMKALDSLNGHVIAMALSRGLLVMGGVWFASADVLN